MSRGSHIDGIDVAAMVIWPAIKDFSQWLDPAQHMIIGQRMNLAKLPACNLVAEFFAQFFDGGSESAGQGTIPCLWTVRKSRIHEPAFIAFIHQTDQKWFTAAGIPIRQRQNCGSSSQVIMDQGLIITEHSPKDDYLKLMKKCRVDGRRRALRSEDIVPGA